MSETATHDVHPCISSWLSADLKTVSEKQQPALSASETMHVEHAVVPCMSAGVMACSQELCMGDVVAVSIAMEAPGSQGYITRGSIVGSNLPAVSSLYIGACLQWLPGAFGI